MKLNTRSSTRTRGGDTPRLLQAASLRSWGMLRCTRVDVFSLRVKRCLRWEEPQRKCGQGQRPRVQKELARAAFDFGSYKRGQSRPEWGQTPQSVGRPSALQKRVAEKQWVWF